MNKRVVGHDQLRIMVSNLLVLGLLGMVLLCVPLSSIAERAEQVPKIGEPTLSADAERQNPTAKREAAAKRYIGKRILVGSSEHEKLGGFAFSGRRNPPRDASGKVLYLVGFIGKEDGRELFLLAEIDKENGRPVSYLILDAVDVPKGQRLLGKPVEDECTSSQYPDDYILVTGVWATKKKKDGNYLGFARSITKAWRVDFIEKKLKEISTKGIKCEDDRTEADFD